MKFLLAILLLSISMTGQSQKPLLSNDETVPIPKLNFDANGNLLIHASSTSSQADFDFLVGKWRMPNRKLNRRLENCKEWTEFESHSESHKILDGTANTDIYYTTEMPGMNGWRFEGLTIRLFNPNTRLWSIYWAASNTGTMDPPVVGSFENNVGHFFCRDVFNGKPIIMMFRWDTRNKEQPLWGQAFSPDNGKTWEWNFFNAMIREN